MLTTATSLASGGQTVDSSQQGTDGTTMLSDATSAVDTTDAVDATSGSNANSTSNATHTSTNTEATESSSGDPIDLTRTVFVLQDVGAPAEYGGITGADALCQDAADAAGLTGTYFAWLSSSAANAPAARFSQDGGPFMRTDGIIIANDWADLTDGELLAPINHVASGEIANETPSDVNVVTSTNADGTFLGAAFLPPCLDYTGDSVYEPDRGSLLEIDGRWSAIGDTVNCNNPSFGLYCFEQ